jgi:hypothetical protein
MIWFYILCFVLGGFASFCTYKISQCIGQAIEADTMSERRGCLSKVSSWVTILYVNVLTLMAIVTGLVAWSVENKVNSVDVRVSALEEVVAPADTIKVVDYVGGEDSK